MITSLPGSDDVRSLCGRLTAALAAEGISMSFGWGVHPRDGESPLLLFRAADERLYAQKVIRSEGGSSRGGGSPSRGSESSRGDGSPRGSGDDAGGDD